MHLRKHHGLGNDFLVVLDPDGEPTAADAVAWCHRTEGVGADGLIVARPDGPGRVRMTLWNSDGSEAELSGNGLRCLGQAVLADAPDGIEDRVVVATAVGDRVVRMVERGEGPTDRLAVEMGEPRLVSVDEPVVRRFPDGVRVVGVDVGNPHVVAVGEAVAGLDPAVIGPEVEALVEGGTNVHLVEVGPGGAVRMRIWERGAGLTMACGSGAVAVAVALRHLGLVSGDVTVDMPGGSATVAGSPGVELIGPATFVAHVEVP